MAQLNQTQCDNVVYFYFLANGWLPPGTTVQNWRSRTFKDIHFDDPPLPGDPDFQKRKVALDLQHAFHNALASIADPFPRLQNGAMTLGDFAVWCLSNQVAVTA